MILNHAISFDVVFVGNVLLGLQIDFSKERKITKSHKIGWCMGLRKCHECSREISTDAATCPGCGAKQKKKTSLIAWAAAFGIVVVIMRSILNAGDAPKVTPTVESSPVSAPSASSSASTSQTTPAVVASAKKAAWAYAASEDKMTKRKIFRATVDSKDLLEFSFPYQGKNQPSLTLRKNANGTTDVLLQIEKGQFLCGVSSCSLNVKFDDKSPVKFTGNGPSDYSTTTVFLSPAGKFVSGIKGAKKVFIEATFYGEGTRVLEFDVEGLDWNH